MKIRGAMGRGGRTGRELGTVALVVEQLRRTVPGGIGTYCRGLLGGLREVAHGGGAMPVVELVASRSPSVPDPLASEGWALRTSKLPGPLLTRAWDRGLVDVDRHADLVHALSLAGPPARHQPLVVTVHDLAFRSVPEAFPERGRRWHEAALGRAIARARYLVVPSAAVADELMGAGAPARSVVVIEHGSDHLPPPDPQATEALLARIEVSGPFVLAVGTLEPRKNLRRLVDAHRQASAALAEPLALVVVGPTGWGPLDLLDGDMEPPVPHHGPRARGGRGEAPVAQPFDAAPGARARAGEMLGARPARVDPVQVVATGPVTPGVLAGLYRRARLVAYVPLAEGWGLPPIEAMAAGTPVLASPVPSTGGAAWEVDPTDVAAIAAGLVTVATDEVVRAELVAAGWGRAAARTWRASAEEHLALWRSVA